MSLGNHNASTQNGGTAAVSISDVPDECPLCHRKGSFSPLALYVNTELNPTDEGYLEVVFRCPSSTCHEIFLAYYIHSPRNFVVVRTAPSNHVALEFSEIISGISSDFSKIYNQALQAEGEGLDEICGPGYRKALEFLIKDYLLKKATDEKEKEMVQKEKLGTCIANRITDARIKEVAKRAAWLGNDETHYVRRWADKDLKDLKKLIDLTVYWIEAEAVATELMRDMPEQ